jgi:hypothetical protein
MRDKEEFTGLSTNYGVPPSCGRLSTQNHTKECTMKKRTPKRLTLLLAIITALSVRAVDAQTDAGTVEEVFTPVGTGRKRPGPKYNRQ